MKRGFIFRLIDHERQRQHELFGDQSKLSRDRMMTVLTEEVGELAEAVLKDVQQWRIEELVHVAAVAVQMLEHEFTEEDTEDEFMDNKTLQDYAKDYQKETGNDPRHAGDNWTHDFVAWFCKRMNEENKINARV